MNERTGESQEVLVTLLTKHQGELRGFILASVGDFSNASDILQRTNLKIWQKAETFDSSAPFLPWAFAIARFEVLAFFRDRKRERVVFQPDVAEMLLDASEEAFEDWRPRQQALHNCVQRLDSTQRDLLRLRYSEGASITRASEQTGQTVQAVKSMLLRVRRKLRHCIQFQLAESE